MEEDRVSIQAFLCGDQAAFTALVNKYRQGVYALAFRFARNHEEADDLAQETFIKAFENLHRFRGDSSFKTWLFRITTNLSINLTKSGRIAKDAGCQPEEGSDPKEADGLGQLIVNERNDMLHRAISKLPPRQKQALLLKTFQDMTCEEVARVMECSPGTVKANVFNAVRRLKSLLKGEQDHG